MYCRKSKMSVLRSVVIILGVLTTSVVSAAEIPPVPVTGKVQWVYDYAQGKELARSNGKPMFVVFRCER